MTAITLEWMNRAQIAWAQDVVTKYHYLQRPVDARCSVQGYRVLLNEGLIIGLLLFGRPEATKVKGWYEGKSYWQVLNLNRVWFAPGVQPGGIWHNLEFLPGFVDRKGQFRSTLVSASIEQALDRVVIDYLMARPPCYLDEPYELKWCLSYCDTRLHKGTVYRAAGFELYRTNENGIQTWRRPLRPLTPAEDEKVRQASQFSQRSQKFRAERQYAGAQMELQLWNNSNS